VTDWSHSSATDCGHKLKQAGFEYDEAMQQLNEANGKKKRNTQGDKKELVPNPGFVRLAIKSSPYFYFRFPEKGLIIETSVPQVLRAISPRLLSCPQAVQTSKLKRSTMLDESWLFAFVRNP
jgi:hypothetical protein